MVSVRWWMLPGALCVVLAAPTPAAAQRPQAEVGGDLSAPTAGTSIARVERSTSAPLPITELPITRYGDEPSPSPPRSDAAVVFEVLGGSLGVVAGLTPLLADESMVAVLPLSLGLGISVGVLGGGALAGGDGTFGSVFLGQATGGMASIPFVLFADDLVVALLAVILLPLTGGVLGYEISNDVPRESSMW